MKIDQQADLRGKFYLTTLTESRLWISVADLRDEKPRRFLSVFDGTWVGRIMRSNDAYWRTGALDLVVDEHGQIIAPPGVEREVIYESSPDYSYDRAHAEAQAVAAFFGLYYDASTGWLKPSPWSFAAQRPIGILTWVGEGSLHEGDVAEVQRQWSEKFGTGVVDPGKVAVLSGDWEYRVEVAPNDLLVLASGIEGCSFCENALDRVCVAHREGLRDALARGELMTYIEQQTAAHRKP
jgi:hypothetical protein